MNWISIKIARPNVGILCCVITRDKYIQTHRYNRNGFSSAISQILGGTKYRAAVINAKGNEEELSKINPDDEDNDMGVTHWFPIPPMDGENNI